MPNIDEPYPSTHDSHDDPFVAAAAQARAFGYDQIARGFEALVKPAEHDSESESTAPANA